MNIYSREFVWGDTAETMPPPGDVTPWQPVCAEL